MFSCLFRLPVYFVARVLRSSTVFRLVTSFTWYWLISFSGSFFVDYCIQFVIVHFCQCVIILDVANIHVFALVLNNHLCENIHGFTLVLSDHLCEIMFYPVFLLILLLFFILSPIMCVSRLR